jgi:hypothetical protein
LVCPGGLPTFVALVLDLLEIFVVLDEERNVPYQKNQRRIMTFQANAKRLGWAIQFL